MQAGSRALVRLTQSASVSVRALAPLATRRGLHNVSVEDEEMMEACLAYQVGGAPSQPASRPLTSMLVNSLGEDQDMYEAVLAVHAGGSPSTYTDQSVTAVDALLHRSASDLLDKKWNPNTCFPTSEETLVMQIKTKSSRHTEQLNLEGSYWSEDTFFPVSPVRNADLLRTKNSETQTLTSLAQINLQGKFCFGRISNALIWLFFKIKNRCFGDGIETALPGSIALQVKVFQICFVSLVFKCCFTPLHKCCFAPLNKRLKFQSNPEKHKEKVSNSQIKSRKVAERNASIKNESLLKLNVLR
eukprot:g2092.t1